MDIGHIHRILCSDYTTYSPQINLFAAALAVNKASNRRTVAK
jgi:hypothetical protein